MSKPPKIPRPQKPPVQPPRPDQRADPTIGLVTEKLIGRLVVGWAKLEACMDDFIWHLLRIEIEQGRVVTARLDATGKIRMVRQLGPLELTEEQFHRLSPIIDQIDFLREDRNLVVHGTWGRSQPENENIVLSLRFKSLEPDEVVAESFPHSRLRTMIGETERLKWELIGLMNELHASPDRPVPRHHAD